MIRFLLIGLLFGVTLSQAEVISWYRIQEMFRLHSFHMYGIIGSAVGLGALLVAAIKKFKLRNYTGRLILFGDKKRSLWRYLLGGAIFGLGWALAGACPGPMFILIGQGFTALAVVVAFAVLGTWVYGLLRDKLPH